MFYSCAQTRCATSNETGKNTYETGNTNINFIIKFFQKLKNYLRMIKNYPELFTDLRPERIKRFLDSGHILASPLRDQNGCRVFILNARNFLRNVFLLVKKSD